MIIEKTAMNVSNYNSEIVYFESARKALSNILLNLKSSQEYTLIIPAYIGFSASEGSGIFDPIVENKMSHKYYSLDRNLNINIDEFKRVIKETNGKKAVLFVHYFGFADANICELVRFCKENDIFIIEDCAHALYSNFVDLSCGDFGDISIYSIHKMLPYEKGGMIKINSKISMDFCENYCLENVFNYRFNEISKARKKNAMEWEKILSEYTDDFIILRPSAKYSNYTPQTFPIIVNKIDRNKLYTDLNNAGFGAVSLYHTMIKPIYDLNFEDAIWVSKRIFNLPVHQDTDKTQIGKMAKKLLEYVK